MSSLLRNILFAFGFALLCWLGYTLFLKDSSSLVEGGVNSEAAIAGQDLLFKLQQIDAVSIDGGVLRDARFESLVDFRQMIVSESTGRENPYMPVTNN